MKNEQKSLSTIFARNLLEIIQGVNKMYEVGGCPCYFISQQWNKVIQKLVSCAFYFKFLHHGLIVFLNLFRLLLRTISSNGVIWVPFHLDVQFDEQLRVISVTSQINFKATITDHRPFITTHTITESLSQSFHLCLYLWTA